MREKDIKRIFDICNRDSEEVGKKGVDSKKVKDAVMEKIGMSAAVGFYTDDAGDEAVKPLFVAAPKKKRSGTAVKIAAVGAAACLGVGVLCTGMFGKGGIHSELPQNNAENNINVTEETAAAVVTEETVKQEDKEQTFTKDYDGVVLTVTTDKSVYCTGESINVTATLENNSGKDINLYYTSAPKNHSVELMVDIEYLIEDPITAMVSCDEVVVVIPVKPGEKYTQHFKFQTYTGFIEQTDSDGNIEYYPDFQNAAGPGLYNGRCHIWVCSDAVYPHGTITDYYLDFSVMLKYEYPVNANGQTYYDGPTDVPSIDDFPDLIGVIATNGKAGYVYKDDMYDYMPSCPEEAVKYMEVLKELNDQGIYFRIIPVYAVDGKTVIGDFEECMDVGLCGDFGMDEAIVKVEERRKLHEESRANGKYLRESMASVMERAMAKDKK